MIKTSKYFFLILTLLFFSCNKKANSNLDEANNDSIAKYLKLAGNDTLAFPLRDKYNQKAFSLIDLSKNDTVVRWYLCQAAINFSITKNNSQYCKISKLHFNKSKEAKDTLNLARYYRYRAGFHKNSTKQFDSMFYYYAKAEKFYKRTNDYEGLARIYFYKGLIQLDFDYLQFLFAELKGHL